MWPAADPSQKRPAQEQDRRTWSNPLSSSVVHCTTSQHKGLNDGNASGKTVLSILRPQAGEKTTQNHAQAMAKIAIICNLAFDRGQQIWGVGYRCVQKIEFSLPGGSESVQSEEGEEEALRTSTQLGRESARNEVRFVCTWTKQSAQDAVTSEGI
ncbi:hypothetical protein K474DRAFT_808516 [Panus rudis PR-1116 ss-1]|nr:hypothetical protein K474DRAFT_808516 [Panus rudis PR-1116 ss-1]